MPSSIPKPRGEREHALQRGAVERALAGDRRLCASPQRRRIAQRANPARTRSRRRRAGRTTPRRARTSPPRPRRQARQFAAEEPRSPSQSTNVSRRRAAPRRARAAPPPSSPRPLPSARPAAHHARAGLARERGGRVAASRRRRPTPARAGNAAESARSVSSICRPHRAPRRSRLAGPGGPPIFGRALLSPSRRPRKRDGGQMADIEAHITGTVWKIECAVGDTVEEGDTVAILESMKMEMPVEAEDSGNGQRDRRRGGPGGQRGRHPRRARVAQQRERAPPVPDQKRPDSLSARWQPHRPPRSSPTASS